MKIVWTLNEFNPGLCPAFKEYCETRVRKLVKEVLSGLQKFNKEELQQLIDNADNDLNDVALYVQSAGYVSCQKVEFDVTGEVEDSTVNFIFYDIRRPGDVKAYELYTEELFYVDAIDTLDEWLLEMKHDT